MSTRAAGCCRSRRTSPCRATPPSWGSRRRWVPPTCTTARLPWASGRPGTSTWGWTEVSPAALAVMAASVARGSYVEPALIKSPAVTGADRAPKPLDAKAASELRTLMRLVVTNGTAQGVLTAVPGGPVYGKTGTAEYGTKKPLATHAWFVGWQGNVAFAVLVEDGKSGAGVAGPIAANFLVNLQH